MVSAVWALMDLPLCSTDFGCLESYVTLWFLFLCWVILCGLILLLGLGLADFGVFAIVIRCLAVLEG